MAASSSSENGSVSSMRAITSRTILASACNQIRLAILQKRKYDPPVVTQAYIFRKTNITSAHNIIVNIKLTYLSLGNYIYLRPIDLQMTT